MVLETRERNRDLVSTPLLAPLELMGGRWALKQAVDSSVASRKRRDPDSTVLMTGQELLEVLLV